jgi:hypothetical protein
VASGAIRADLGDIGFAMTDRLALARAFEDAGIERAKAERLATVIVEMVRGSVATKADVQAMGAELKAAIAALRYLPPPGHSG